MNNKINNFQEKNNQETSEKSEKLLLKNKKLIIITVLLLIFALLVPVGYSLFSDVKNEEADLKIGEIEVVLVEDWPEKGEVNPDNPQETYDEFGLSKYTKKVHGQSTKQQDSYVRIRCIPIVEYYVEGNQDGEGEWITAPVSQDNIIVAVNSEDWVQEGDYWYYTKILKGFEKTGILNIDWQVAEIPSEISSCPIRTDVRVILEYSQVSNNMWKDIFQIEDLPAEVERVQE